MKVSAHCTLSRKATKSKQIYDMLLQTQLSIWIVDTQTVIFQGHQLVNIRISLDFHLYCKNKIYVVYEV